MFIKRKPNIPPHFRFTRVVFGVIMIGAFFFTWGRWVTMALGVLFLISAYTGFCITCEIYKKIWGCKECDEFYLKNVKSSGKKLNKTRSR